MRGKRSKQYRKLMQQYCISFGFRQPYQCVVDADLVKDTTRFKMDLVASLERTLHGKVKPLITQCSIRHLYANNSDPTVAEAIEVAKSVCERRRCGHHPDEFPEPLSTLACLSSVVDPSGSGNNKHRYCVASQDAEVRRAMRAVRGVPLVYVSRSVMIMEPISSATAQTREREEAGKFRDGIIRSRAKRKRGDDDDGEADEKDDGEEAESGSGSEEEDERDRGAAATGKAPPPAARTGRVDGEGGPGKKKKRKYGPKGPNPLSVRKSKKSATNSQGKKSSTRTSGQDTESPKAQKKRRKGNEAPGVAASQ